MLLNREMLRILVALMLVAIIMFTAAYAVFNNSMNELGLQVVENNRLLIKDNIRTFEECLKEVNNILYTLYIFPYDAYDPYSNNDISLYNASIIYKKLSQLISSKNYIEDIVLFYGNSPLAITSKGTINFEVLIDKKYRSEKYSSDYWMNYARTKHPMKVIPVSEYAEIQDVVTNSLFSKKLMCIVGSNQYYNSGLNILVFLKSEFLFKDINLLKGSSYIIMDNDRNILIDSTQNESINELGEIYFNEGQEKVFKQGGYQYYCLKSDYNGYIYIYKMPLNMGISSVLKTNQILLLISIFFGIVISLALSFLLYRPLKNIKKLLNGDADKKCREKSYTNICSSIENIRRENEYFRQEMVSAEYDIQRSIFSKMLDDVDSYKNIKEQIDRYFKCIFNSKHFMMAGFLVENSKDRAGRYESILYSEDIVAILGNALKKKIDSTMLFQVSNKQFLALIGQTEKLWKEKTARDIEYIIMELESSCLSGYSIMAAVSREYVSPQDCRTAYGDIKMCFSYRNIKPSKSVIDIENVKFDHDVYFPDELLEKLSNCLIFGNMNECTGIINQIIEKNIENNISLIRFSEIVKEIFNRIKRLLPVKSITSGEIAELERALFDKIEKSRYDELSEFLKDIIAKVNIKSEKNKQNYLNKEFVAQYINHHYYEDLYLDNMAELFGTSPKYFSNYFKKAFGINFVEYVNKARIFHAKQYLETTSLTLNEVGEKVGYINTSTFTSTFKKYCGVSPNKYKEFYSRKTPDKKEALQ